jgi:hypothetical protein
MIELDFADTSALSDPEAFAKQEQRAKNRKSQKKGRKERERDREREREEIENSWDVPPPVEVPSPPPQGVVSTPPVAVNGKGKHERKERAGSLISQSSNGDRNAIDSRTAHASLLSVLTQKKNANLKDLSRNDFVREVLTLIYVCLLCLRFVAPTDLHVSRQTKSSLTLFGWSTPHAGTDVPKIVLPELIYFRSRLLFHSNHYHPLL